jgi:hypothetical protein
MSKHAPVFHLAAKSGLVAAATAADSVLFAWRNPSTTAAQFLHRLEAWAQTVTGYSAAFEHAIEARDVSSFDGAAYTGGTDLSHPTTAANKAYRRISVNVLGKPAQETVLGSGDVRIATTGGLSHAGSPVIASHPFAYGSVGELVTGDAVPRGRPGLVWEQLEINHEQVGRHLAPGAGFVLRNPNQLGAGGTMRLFVSVLWSELG